MRIPDQKFDRFNAVLAAIVFVGAFIVYALTVQRTFSFWDCGEFIASAYVLGIPHPPGTPLYILLGKVFSLIPFVDDISYRVNYISVISSAFTAMFSYLLTVRLVGHFFSSSSSEEMPPEKASSNRFIAYIGGIAGGFFVAFSNTNWANSVEAEVYGLSLALMVMIAWLTVRYFEIRHTEAASKIMILAVFVTLVGVGLHLTVVLMVPFFAMFFALKPSAGPRSYFALCAFFILELIFIAVFANGRGGVDAYYAVTAILSVGLLIYLRQKIRWAIAIALASLASIVIGFEMFFFVAPAGLAVLVVLAFLSEKLRWRLEWKTAMAILIVCFIGFSIHFYLPIRSAHDPRINENDPSKSYQTFVDFLERKQYGHVSMVDRMFKRRAEWSNQFGRHPHMGFWSYFEEQYSSPGWGFLPFLALGILGFVVAIRKRLELGLPFLTLFLICSAGLILYMNFADGTLYDPAARDAWLEVRERDYFFTPAFVLFGVAMGLGVAALIGIVRDRVGQVSPVLQKPLVYALSLLILLPGVSLSRNYHSNDRSESVLPWVFGANILDTCEKDAILFTTGDNETFTLWCLQEVYGYRTDVRVVNRALLNGNWYVEQVKNTLGVKMSLTDEQIIDYPLEVRPGRWASRPNVKFDDRPRGVRTYLAPYRYGDQVVTVPNMIVDDIVLENQDTYPIYFSSMPYAASPLKLTSRLTSIGVLNRLEPGPPESLIDVDGCYDLFMNTYRFTGLENSKVYRSNGVTRDFMLTFGTASVRTFEELVRRGEQEKAIKLMEKVVKDYPENWQAYVLLAHQYDQLGDSTRADEILNLFRDTMTTFTASNEDNLYYRQDLGMVTYEIGRRHGNPAMIDEGISIMRQAFMAKPNDVYLFRKLLMMLSEQKRLPEMQEALREVTRYRRNLEDPLIQRLMQRN